MSSRGPAQPDASVGLHCALTRPHPLAPTVPPSPAVTRVPLPPRAKGTEGAVAARVASVIFGNRSYGTQGRFYPAQWNIGPVCFRVSAAQRPGQPNAPGSGSPGAFGGSLVGSGRFLGVLGRAL